MKLFSKETNEPKTDTRAEECAAILMEVVPMVMGRIRTEMRAQRSPGLSVPELRSLSYLSRNEGASLSELADHLYRGLPSVSKIIDALVARKLVIRSESSDDRRFIKLALSAHGRNELTRVRRNTGRKLAQVLAELTPSQEANIIEALNTLRQLFSRR